MSEIRLTQFSHGGGCGCKLSPSILHEILSKSGSGIHFKDLLVGNDTNDDAAVFKFDEEFSVVSTTDFFTPIVDDPYIFGQIAATNAISDIYAMGASPLMSIAILGWPIDKIPAMHASEVIKGARSVCDNAEIALAGGHSIDTLEPIFGLAVTGKIKTKELKKNSEAEVGDLIYLTKPLGIGLITTAEKKGIAETPDKERGLDSMLQLNKVGSSLSSLDFVHAITDVTGFGLAGHLIEVSETSSLSSVLNLSQTPTFDFVEKYISQGCMPGGTNRNWDSYGDKVLMEKNLGHEIICDPQTSGGLLISVGKDHQSEFEDHMTKFGYSLKPCGKFIPKDQFVLKVTASF